MIDDYSNDSRLFDAKEDAEQRRSILLPIVLDAIKRVEDRENGYTLQFAPGGKHFLMISDWILTELYCNPFLRYQMTIEPNEGPIKVEISGPAGTKDLLMSELGLSRWL